MFMLPEELTIQHLEQLEASLNKLVREDEPVMLDGSSVVKVDTAGIQLLCALQKSLQLTNKKIGWSGVSEALFVVASTLGTKDYLGIQR
jgi:anti-anti-sigma regulatory factor